MQDRFYNSSSDIKKFLEHRNLGMQKKFGQNFLIDKNIREQLVDALNLDTKKTVWEIGPGLGCMTDLLLKTGANVIAFEIDRGFIEFLIENFEEHKNFYLIEGDVLKTWKLEAEKKIPDCFFGNLPYNIASTLILDTIEAGVFFPKCLVTVQKEVAKRFSAKSGKYYSAVSVLVQAFYKIENIRDIGASSFWPAPNVVSTVIALHRKLKYHSLLDKRELFFSLVKGLFFARRKTLKNNFQNWLKKHGLPEFLVDKILSPKIQTLRAENLTVQDFVNLTELVVNKLEKFK